MKKTISLLSVILLAFPVLDAMQKNPPLQNGRGRSVSFPLVLPTKENPNIARVKKSELFSEAGEGTILTKSNDKKSDKKREKEALLKDRVVPLKEKEKSDKSADQVHDNHKTAVKSAILRTVSNKV